jgi:hypothetical protein
VYLESRVGFDVDGVELKARLDFAAKAIDWRGFWNYCVQLQQTIFVDSKALCQKSKNLAIL